MREIKEAKNVGSDVYERTVGVTLNLHELVEGIEQIEFIIGSGDGDFCVGSEVEYEVFVSGKPVDASKISISIYNKEEDKPDVYFCEARGEELYLEEIEEAQGLNKMSKDELIAKVLYYRAGNV